MKYICWLSHTCYVCKGGDTSSPGTLHISCREYRPTSPCDTIPVVIEAKDRHQARRLFAARRPQ